MEVEAARVVSCGLKERGCQISAMITQESKKGWPLAIRCSQDPTQRWDPKCKSEEAKQQEHGWSPPCWELSIAPNPNAQTLNSGLSLDLRTGKDPGVRKLRGILLKVPHAILYYTVLYYTILCTIRTGSYHSGSTLQGPLIL